MPKKTYKLNDFSGGLNWLKDPRDIQDNELVQADFCYLDRVGGVRGSGVFNPGGQTIPPEGTHTAGGGYYSFESDHVSGSSAPQTGARWLCTVDGLDGTFEASAIVGSEIETVTTSVDLGSPDAPSWTANQLDFDPTMISRNSGSYFDDANLENGDFVQISGCSTSTVRNCYTFITAAGPERLLLGGNGISSASGNEGGTPVIKRLIRPVFFDADDDVRIADATFSASTQRKKYSYIKRTHFIDAGDAKDEYYNWYANNCDLTSPTLTAIEFSDATCDTNHSAGSGSTFGSNPKIIQMDSTANIVVGMSVSGTGIAPGSVVSQIDSATLFRVNLDTTATNTNTTLTFGASYAAAGTGFELTAATPAGGSFAAKTWQIASSFIYENEQESLLHIPLAGVNSDQPVTITTVANDYIDLDVRVTAPFDERLTGGRIYIRESETSDPWSMLVDISLKDGVRAQFDSEYKAWERDGDDAKVKVDTTKIMAENFETYSIINGFPPDEFKNDLSVTGESYKDAILANRRCFVANVKMLDPEGNGTSDLIRMRDRIMYTPPNKFDTFPRSNFIDVVRGDADEYTALAYYADRLFAFKSKTLYIINISSPSPVNWFLESTERDKGVNFPCSVWTAKKGVYWANFNGVFWFNGSDIVELLDGKMTTVSDISGNRMVVTEIPIVWYDPEINSLFVKASAYSYDNRSASMTSDNKGTWVYNFSSGGWSRIRYDAFGTETLEFYSNIVKSGGNNFYAGSITQQKGDGSLDTTSNQGEFSNDLIATNGSIVADKQILKTKDIDFGDPSRIKKIYSVTITYKASAAMTTPISYATDGGSSYTNFTGNFSDTGAGTYADNWAKLRATLASPVECQSMQLKVQNTAQGSFQINDISIEYRDIYKRVS